MNHVIILYFPVPLLILFAGFLYITNNEYPRILISLLIMAVTYSIVMYFLMGSPSEIYQSKQALTIKAQEARQQWQEQKETCTVVSVSDEHNFFNGRYYKVGYLCNGVVHYKNQDKSPLLGD